MMMRQVALLACQCGGSTRHLLLQSHHVWARHASSSSDGGPTRGRTAGELGDDAAQSMQGAEGKAAGAGSKVEPKVSEGFVPTENAVPSPDAAGRAGGIGAGVMGDMLDTVEAVFAGDNQRAGQDVADMTRHQNTDANTDAHTEPPHTTTQDWPRGSITDPAASPASSQAGVDASRIGEAAFVNTDEAHAAGTNRYEGTIPHADPSPELPDVDQDPPESVAAGPTPGYGARGGDTRPV